MQLRHMRQKLLIWQIMIGNMNVIEAIAFNLYLILSNQALLFLLSPFLIIYELICICLGKKNTTYQFIASHFSNPIRSWPPCKLKERTWEMLGMCHIFVMRLPFSWHRIKNSSSRFQVYLNSLFGFKLWNNGGRDFQLKTWKKGNK